MMRINLFFFAMCAKNFQSCYLFYFFASCALIGGTAQVPSPKDPRSKKVCKLPLLRKRPTTIRTMVRHPSQKWRSANRTIVTSPSCFASWTHKATKKSHSCRLFSNTNMNTNTNTNCHRLPSNKAIKPPNISSRRASDPIFSPLNKSRTSVASISPPSWSLDQAKLPKKHPVCDYYCCLF
jgi:hypothetical protein